MSFDKLKQDIIDVVMADDLFTKDEALALLRSISADTPEELPDNLDKVIRWARTTRSRVAVLDVILTLGRAGAIDVRPAPNDDISLKLTLDPSAVKVSR